MNVFVDYDNIRQQHTNKGLVYIVDRVLQAVASKHASPQRARFRLYGGWYQWRTLTRRAQSLIAEIGAQFPRVMPIGMASVVVNVELAYSLEIDPSKHLWHTYRPYGGKTDVACKVPSAAGCTVGSCALENMHTFLTTRGCPEPGCVVEPDDLLFKSQQKLVDTMLTADVIFRAQTDTEPPCVVTSDDDLWPALKTALLYGRTVLHVHTLPGHRTPAHYSGGVSARYVELAL